MFNKALFKLEWKSNYKILIIFGLILTMYTTVMLTMYDPKLGTALETFAETMPEISFYLFIWIDYDCISINFWSSVIITIDC